MRLTLAIALIDLGLFRLGMHMEGLSKGDPSSNLQFALFLLSPAGIAEGDAVCCFPGALLLANALLYGFALAHLAVYVRRRLSAPG